MVNLLSIVSISFIEKNKKDFEKYPQYHCIPFPRGKKSTLYSLRLLRNSSDKILKVTVTTERSRVISRSHHNVATLPLTTNVSTKYQFPVPYSFQDISQTRF